MDKKILLVSTTEIIANSPIQDNVDVKLLAKTLNIVQETSYKQILGSILYSGLTEAVYLNVVSGTPLESKYVSLIDASKPYLIAKATSDFIIVNQYKFTSKGILKYNDNSSSNITESDLQNIKDYYDNLISGYKSDLIEFLRDSNLLNTADSTDLEITSEASGWYLGIPFNSCEIPSDVVTTVENYVEPAIANYNYQQLYTLRSVLLISTEDIISNTVIQDNVDVKLLAKTIQTVQEVNLRPILSEEVYYPLVDSIYQNIESGTTISALYDDMMTLVKPYLYNKVVAEFIIPNNYKFTNKGLLKLNDNSATNISEGDLQAVKDYYDNISTTYKKQLISFLEKYGLTNCDSDRDLGAEAAGWYLGDINIPESPQVGVLSPGGISSVSFNGNTLTISEVDGSVFNTNINNFISVISNSVSATTFSGGTFFGNGSGLTGVIAQAQTNPTDQFIPFNNSGTFADSFIKNDLVNNILSTDYNGDNFGFKFDFNSSLYDFGDLRNLNFLRFDTGNNVFALHSNNQPDGIAIDLSLQTYSFGNFSNGNSTKFEIDDRAFRAYTSYQDIGRGINLDFQNRIFELGNYEQLIDTGLVLKIDSGFDTIETKRNNFPRGLKLNYGTDFYALGDYANNSNGYAFFVDGANRKIAGLQNSVETGLVLDYQNSTYTLGDLTSPTSARIIVNNSTAQVQVPSGSTLVTTQDAFINEVQVGRGTSGNNTIVGTEAGGSSTFSSYLGYRAGRQSTTASTQNVGVGYEALFSNTGGSFNAAVGLSSMRNAQGSQNAAIGYESLRDATGSFNSMNGYRAGRLITSGSFNTGVGNVALANHLTSSGNTAIGYASSFGSNSTGSDNVSIGYSSLRQNRTGARNTMLGFEAGDAIISGSSNVFIGYRAGKNETGSNLLYISNSDTSTPLIGGNFTANTLTLNATTSFNEFGISKVGYTQYDTTPTTYVPAAGNIGWDDTNGTLELTLKGGVVRNELGQNLLTRVVNKTVPLIDLSGSSYQVVVIAGATGQRLSVKLAQANNDANSAGTLGIVTEDIARNQEGFITTVGLIKNINTTGALQGETWADGNILYLSPFTAGTITNIKPVAPNHTVIVGYVEYAHGVNGKIYVKIDNGYELDELHNVRISAVTGNQILQYNSTDSVWENKSFVTASTTNTGVLSSTDWNTFNNKANVSQTNNDDVRGLQGLGSVIKAAPIGLSLNRITTTLGLTSGRLQLTAVYVAVESTVSGVKFYQATQGNFTANNTNSIALFSYDSSTGNASIVAVTANDGNIWKATTGTWTSAAFLGSVTIQPGTYYIGMLYNAVAGAAQVPVLGAAVGFTNAIVQFDFPNSGKLTCHIVSQNNMPSGFGASSTINNPVNAWINLY